MKTFFILLCLATCVLAQNYCTMTCNRKNIPKTHVACNNKGSFGTSCGSTAKVVTMTPELIQSILDNHNNYRNEIAGGFRGVTAANMSTMKWHPELARLAQLNANSCVMLHDCNPTTEFPYSGQNIYQAGTTGALTDSEIPGKIKMAIDKWYIEKEYCTLAQIRSYPSVEPANIIGHFTALVKDKSTHVGCGGTTRSSKGWNYIQITCNYANTNMEGQETFVEGPVASKCKSGRSSIYKNLCA